MSVTNLGGLDYFTERSELSWLLPGGVFPGQPGGAHSEMTMCMRLGLGLCPVAPCPQPADLGLTSATCHRVIPLLSPEQSAAHLDLPNL